MDNIYVKTKTTNNMSKVIERNVAEILTITVFIVTFIM